MQDCEKEVAYMRDEQNKILKQDWSDQMIDHADVRRQYEVSKLGFKLIAWLEDCMSWRTDIPVDQQLC